MRHNSVAPRLSYHVPDAVLLFRQLHAGCESIARFARLSSQVSHDRFALDILSVIIALGQPSPDLVILVDDGG
jgi:hypothetical protein